MAKSWISETDYQDALAALESVERTSIRIWDCRFMANVRVEKLPSGHYAVLTKITHTPHPDSDEDPPTMPSELRLRVNEATCLLASDMFSISKKDDNGLWQLIFEDSRKPAPVA